MRGMSAKGTIRMSRSMGEALLSPLDQLDDPSGQRIEHVPAPFENGREPLVDLWRLILEQMDPGRLLLPHECVGQLLNVAAGSPEDQVDDRLVQIVEDEH